MMFTNDTETIKSRVNIKYLKQCLMHKVIPVLKTKILRFKNIINKASLGNIKMYMYQVVINKKTGWL